MRVAVESSCGLGTVVNRWGNVKFPKPDSIYPLSTALVFISESFPSRRYVSMLLVVSNYKRSPIPVLCILETPAKHRCSRCYFRAAKTEPVMEENPTRKWNPCSPIQNDNTSRRKEKSTGNRPSQNTFWSSPISGTPIFRPLTAPKCSPFTARFGQPCPSETASKGTYRYLIHPQIIRSISNRLHCTIRRHTPVGCVRVKVIRHLSIELVSRLGLSTACIPATAASTSASSGIIPSPSAVGSSLGGSRWFGSFVVPGMGK